MVLIKVSSNIEKARSMNSMAINTLEMIAAIDKSKFPSNIIRQYYDVIRELASILMLLDGYRTIGDSAHKETIEYIREHYKHFNKAQMHLMDELRILRNDISYDGFHIEYEYLERTEKDIISIIKIFQKTIKKRLEV